MAKKSIAPWVAAGLITGASNWKQRRDELKVKEQLLKLKEREVELDERMSQLTEREQVLQNIKLSKTAFGIDSAFEHVQGLQDQSKQAGVHKLGGMAGTAHDTPTVSGLKDQYRPSGYGTPQGPGLTQALGALKKTEEKPVDPRDEEMKDLELQSKRLSLQKSQRDFAQAGMTEPQKREQAWFPQDPNQSVIYEPLLAAVKQVADSGASPMQADYYSVLFSAVQENLKQMEGTVTPELVAKAAKYLVNNAQAFGTYEKQNRFMRPDKMQYTPPQAGSITPEEIANRYEE